MDDNIIISTSQQSAGSTAANVSLLKLGTVTQTMIGVVVTSVVIMATIATVILIGTGVGYQPPVARPDTVSVYKGDLLTIFPLHNDMDPKNSPLRITKVSQPSFGTVTINSDQVSLSYQSSGTYTGDDVFEYTITNDKLTAKSTVQVHVLNHVPECIDMEFKIPRNSQKNAFALFDIEQNGAKIVDLDTRDELVIDTIEQQPSVSGTATHDNKTLYYTPAHGFSASETVVYRVTDGYDTCNGTLTFHLINNAPVAVPDQLRVRKNMVHELDLLANDYDVNNDEIKITDIGYSAGATSVNADSTKVIYRALPSTAPYYDSFEYMISDFEPLNSTSFATIEVYNTAPVAENSNVEVAKTSVDNRVRLVYSDVDDMDVLTVTITQPPKHGTYKLLVNTEMKQVLYAGEAWFEVPNNLYSVLYTPNKGSDNDDVIEFKVTDSYDTATGYVYFKVINNAPTARDDSFDSHRNIPIDIDVLANDSDVDGDELELVVSGTITTAQGGQVTKVSNKLLRYTPPSKYVGTDTFQYTIKDVTSAPANSKTATATVTMTVKNDAPRPQDDVATVIKTNSIEIDVLANDVDPNNDPLTVASVSAVNVGSSVASVIQGGKKVKFVADRTMGSVSFTYEVADDLGLKSTATVVVKILNSKPVAQPMSATTNWNHSVTIQPNLPLDVDGDTVSVASHTQPTRGRVTLSSGRFLYEPENGFVGTDTFTYTVTDGFDESTPATITVIVANTAPITESDSATVHWRNTDGVLIDVLSNDRDDENDKLYIKSLTSPTKGSVSIVTSSGKSVVKYVPASTQPQVGTFSFRYVVSDWNMESTGDVTVSVTNTKPVAVEDKYSMHWRDKSITFNVLTNDVDANSDPLKIASTALTVSPSNVGSAAIVDANTGLVRFTVPSTVVLGTASFSYSVSDGIQNADAPGQVSVEVTNNDKPVTSPLSRTIHWRTLKDANFVEFNVYDAVKDKDGDDLLLSKTDPTNGLLSVYSVTGSPSTLRFSSTPQWRKGTASATYTLSDTVSSSTNSISIEVTNNKPTASDIEISLAPKYLNSGIRINVLDQASDPDPEDRPYLTIQAPFTWLTPQRGNAELVTDPTLGPVIHYTPTIKDRGTDQFTYTISDGLETVTAKITIKIDYDEPKPTDQFEEYHWRDVQSGTILDLCDKIATVPCTLTQVAPSPQPTGTPVLDSGSNTVTYTPVPLRTGTDKFVVLYTNDITPDIPITVTISVTNTPPKAENKEISRHWRDLLNLPINVLDFASDANADPISLVTGSVSDVKARGQTTVNGNVITFALKRMSNNLYYVGSDIPISYSITDQVDTYSALVNLVATNAPPVPPARSFDVHWSSYKNGRSLDVIQDLTDPNGDNVRLYSVGTGPSGAVSSIAISGTNNVVITGTPSVNYVGKSFTFAYEVTDEASVASSTVIVTITNTPPVAKVTPVDIHWRERNVQFAVNDISSSTDGDALKIQSCTLNQGALPARVTIASDGQTVTYSPTDKFVGAETLACVVSDGIQSSTSTININVYNHAPVAKNYAQSDHWSANPSYTFHVLDDAVENDELDKTQLSLLTQGLENAMYTVNNGIITITPDNVVRASGLLVTKYYITDGKDVSEGTIQITFTNTVPVASNKAIELDRVYGSRRYVLEGSKSLLSAGSVDQDGDPLALFVLSGGKLLTDNKVELALNDEPVSTTSNVVFYYHDGLVQSQPATASVTYKNYAPACQPNMLVLTKGETKSVNVVCTDANGDPIVYAEKNKVSGLSVSGSTFTYTAAVQRAQTIQVPFTGTDVAGAVGSNTLTIQVVSDPPVANDYTWEVFALRNSNTHQLNYLTAAKPTHPNGDVLRFEINSVGNTCPDQSITVSGNIITFVRPYTFSSATCSFQVNSIDYDNQYVTKTVTVVVTTSGLQPVGRSITVDHMDGGFFTMTNADILINDRDPLGGTLKFEEFFVPDSCATIPVPQNGYCGNVAPVQVVAGTWRLSQTSVECQTQRFKYRFRSVQDPSQYAEATLDVRFMNCKCTKPLDIVFVVDGSGSVGDENFGKIRTFLKDIVAPLDVGSGDNQIRVGVVRFSTSVTNVQALTTSKTTFNSAVTSMSYPQGYTNIKGGILAAEKMLKGTNSRPTVPKMIITIFDGEPTKPCSCSDCGTDLAACQSVRYPARDCSHCSDNGLLKCSPCADPVPDTQRINAKKPGNDDGYWRIMSIGVGPFLENQGARDLVRALSYDQNLSLAVNWNQLSTIVSTIQSQSCDLVDTSTPFDLGYEGTDIYAYCGQIVGISNGERTLYARTTSAALNMQLDNFNSVDSRGSLFQITGCGNFGDRVIYGQSVTLYSLETQNYVTSVSNVLYANSAAAAQASKFTLNRSGMTVNNVATLVDLRVKIGTNQIRYNSGATSMSSSSCSSSQTSTSGCCVDFSLLSVSYDDIKYRAGLPNESTLPVPVTDTARKGLSLLV